MKLFSVKTQLLGTLVASLLAPSFALANNLPVLLSSVPVELAGSDLIDNSGTTVTFLAGRVGTASLRISLINHTDSTCGAGLEWETLRLYTNDNSPITTVVATLYRTPLSGTNAGAGLPVASVTSTDTPVIHVNSVDFTHRFDFCTDAYYIRVNVTRTSTAANVNALAVQLL